MAFMKPAAQRSEKTLYQQLLLECKAMTRYALGRGLAVSPTLLSALDKLLSEEESQRHGKKAGVSSAESEAQTPTDQDKTQVDNAAQLAKIHTSLANLIAPAQPRSVFLIQKELDSPHSWSSIGSVPLIRHMLLVAVLALITFIGLSLSGQIDGDPEKFSLVHNSGWSLLVNEIFLVAAAAVGASFYSLFQANSFVSKGTFDPIHESSYWIRLVLGIMAGTILALLIPIEEYLKTADGTQSSWNGLGKATLALIGGFSSTLVYRVMNRLVAAVESMVRNDMSATLALQQQTYNSRLDAMQTQTRLDLAKKVAEAQQIISQSSDPEAVREELNRLQQDLISMDNSFSAGFVSLETENVAPANSGQPTPANGAGQPKNAETTDNEAEAAANARAGGEQATPRAT